METQASSAVGQPRPLAHTPGYVGEMTAVARLVPSA
jgi:hypothetical protein